MRREQIDYGREPTPSPTPRWKAFGIVMTCVLAALVVMQLVGMWYFSGYGS